MAEVSMRLNPDEQKVIRQLAVCYDAGESIVRFSGLPICDEIGVEKVRETCKRLNQYGLVEFAHRSGVKIKPQILEALDQIDNPPPRDYPNEVKTWFFSKPWSLPFWILVVGLPALVGYVTMTKLLLQWLGFLN